MSMWVWDVFTHVAMQRSNKPCQSGAENVWQTVLRRPGRLKKPFTNAFALKRSWEIELVPFHYYNYI